MHPTRATLGALVVVAAVAACGGDATTTTTTTADATTTSPADTTPASTVPAASTELRFTVGDVSGYEGFYLLADVMDRSTDAYVGSVCWEVDADPWSGTGAVRTATAADPCTYDPPYGVVLATDGEYHYVVALHEPTPTPAAACIVGDVTVQGPTEVALNGADFVTPCPETIMRG